MGVIKHFSCDSNSGCGCGGGCNCNDNKQELFLPNPDPNNYTILRHHKVSNFLIAEIKYHDCINYAGKKILVFKDASIKDIFLQKEIDPHFLEKTDKFYPIARFVPTEEGWNYALKFAESIS